MVRDFGVYRDGLILKDMHAGFYSVIAFHSGVIVQVVLQEEMDALRERVGSLEKQLGEEGQRCRETEGKYSREKQEWEEKVR